MAKETTMSETEREKEKNKAHKVSERSRDSPSQQTNERTSHLFVREQNTIEKTKETNTPKPVEPQNT